MGKIVAFGNQKGGVGKSTVIAMAANEKIQQSCLILFWG